MKKLVKIRSKRNNKKAKYQQEDLQESKKNQLLSPKFSELKMEGLLMINRDAHNSKNGFKK